MTGFFIFLLLILLFQYRSKLNWFSDEGAHVVSVLSPERSFISFLRRPLDQSYILAHVRKTVPLPWSPTALCVGNPFSPLSLLFALETHHSPRPPPTAGFSSHWKPTISPRPLGSRFSLRWKPINSLRFLKDRVTTGARSRQPFRMLNHCGEALALTICRRGGEEVRFTLEDGGGK